MIVFSLRLGDDGSPHGRKNYCRLPPPVAGAPITLRFVITAGARASRTPILATNLPLASGKSGESGSPGSTSAFVRSRFARIPFLAGDGLSDPHCDILVLRPGAFEYFVEYTDQHSGKPARSEISGHIVVDPRLCLPDDSIQTTGSTADHSADHSADPGAPPPRLKLLPLDGITVLTVIPKWLPSLSKWPPFFQVFSESGYNMVHFAPLNMRGISNSPYSIYDQLALSNDLFDRSPDGHPPTEPQKEALLKHSINAIHRNNKILSITDIVWNHTACNSRWLLDHPEAGYSVKTTPHLRPAFELDEAIIAFSDQLASVYGLPDSIQHEHELSPVLNVFTSKVIPALNLWQFYVVEAKTAVSAFRDLWTSYKSNATQPPPPAPFDVNKYNDVDLGHMLFKERATHLARDALIDPRTYCRFSKTFDIPVVMSFIYKLSRDLGVSETDRQVDLFAALVDEINLAFYYEADGDISAIKEQVANRARYLRVAEHGPRLGPVSKHEPLVDTYFTRLPVCEATQDRHPDELMLANNGWIWNADPLVNFAAEGSKAYLRRDVIPWGDCVKLRYGDGPEDNPWLWEHQAEYTRKMARIFHGLRIDNCHSTPIHVAQYFLDVAREVNENLYVFAELFTGSEEKDILFVSKLGINSLIREAMNAWDPHELSRQVHHQGGLPVGAFTLPAEYFPLDMLGHNLNSVFYDACESSTDIVVELRGSKPHNLFMDCTHDNETPHQKRTAEDTLPNAAVVAMSVAAVGSVKGYDEIVPELLNVVTECRKYRLPDTFEGIIPAKSMLYALHTKMAREGYCEIHVNQEHDFISIHRVHPVTHDGYLLIARSAFRGGRSHHVHSPIVLRNQSVHVLESATLTVQTGATQSVSSPSLSASRSNDHMNSDSENDELMPPLTPTQLYHAFDAITFEEALRRNMVSSDCKRRRRVLGYISGLPSSLEFSTVLSHISHAFVEQIGDSGDIQTIITIDPTHFVPGSIVLYRTWVVGTGMEQDLPTDIMRPSSGSDIDRSLTPVPDSSGLNGRIAVGNGRPAGIDLTTTAKSDTNRNGRAGITLSIVDTPLLNEPVGVFERLWEHLGMTHHNTAIEMMVRFGYGLMGSTDLWFNSIDSRWPPGLYESVKGVREVEINMALYRCGPEENEMIGDSVYNVPGLGPLTYCGLQGIVSAIMPVARVDDLGAALFQNMRQGPWLIDYTYGRLRKLARHFPRLEPVHAWLQTRLELVKSLPVAFIPKYFAIVVKTMYEALKHRALTLRTGRLSLRDTRALRASSLEKLGESCIMTTFQMYGIMKSTGLFPVPYPLDVYGKHDPVLVPSDQRQPSLAAGLPHFASQHMRCWGRDIFIALRGMFLVPGHFSAARAHLIAFGSTLRHGIIPNLLDQGSRPRYNARDAVWFWFRAVCDYCRYSPEGLAFLDTRVARRFVPKKRYMSGPDFGVAPDTDHVAGGSTETVDLPDADTYIEPTDPRVYKYTSTIAELCQEILERHARGIRFREWNAGSNLDHAMRSEGFDIQIDTDWETRTGFVRGGNRWNCGTWMDKMGDSEKAGTRGVPATPRDGSPVEIIGLLKGVLHWIAGDVVVRGREWWPWHGVHVPARFTQSADVIAGSADASKDALVTYAEWDAMVQRSFERHFYIPLDASDDKKYDIGRQELINRRGIYKDVVGSSLSYMDYQLRPNICIAMVVASEMFDPDHARGALLVIRDALLGPMGIKTLDPKDWAYRGTYDNSNDSSDPTVAHGFNYHQGPEWVWVLAYFLRAYIYFFTRAPGHDAASINRELIWVQRVLFRHKVHLADTAINPFAGLPELTNEDGRFCHGSCPTQAWSTAVLLEVVEDLTKRREL